MFRRHPPDCSNDQRPSAARRAPPATYAVAFAVAPFAAMYAVSNPAVAVAVVVAAVAVASFGRPGEE